MSAPHDTDAPFAATPLSRFLEHLAAPVPDPGGGAAAGVVIATGAALVQMTAGYAAPGPDRDRALAAAARARHDALAGAEADARVSGALVAAFRLPEETPDRAERIRTATLDAAASSVALVDIAAALTDALVWLESHGEARLAPDVAVAARMLACGIRSTAINIRCDATSAAQFGAHGGSIDGLRRDEASAHSAADLLDQLAARVTASL